MKQFYLSINLVILIVFGQAWSTLLHAQDVHFSHIHASPTVLNPALTGLFEGDIRVISNFRQQWKSVPADYRTVALGMDMSLFNIGKLDFVSGGIQLLSDRAGDLAFGSTQLNVSGAFTKSLDRFGDNYVALGIQSSVVNQTMDISRVNSFDAEPLLAADGTNNRTYGDISAGLGLFLNPNRQWMMYIGGAVFHIGRPNVNLGGASSLEGDQLYRRWVVHGGMEYNPNPSIQFMPSFIFMDQGPHREISTGTFIRMNLQPQAKTKGSPHVYAGGWVRWYLDSEAYSGIDALILSMRLDHRQLSYTFSYDINLSSLSAASNFRGGPELSIIYTHNRKRKIKHRKRMKCPRF